MPVELEMVLRLLLATFLGGSCRLPAGNVRQGSWPADEYTYLPGLGVIYRALYLCFPGQRPRPHRRRYCHWYWFHRSRRYPASQRRRGCWSNIGSYNLVGGGYRHGGRGGDVLHRAGGNSTGDDNIAFAPHKKA